MKTQKSCSKMIIVTMLALSLLLTSTILASPAPLKTVLIDFGNAASWRGVDVPNPDINGNTWNSVWSGAYYQNMFAADGSTTTIDFGFSSAGGTDSYNGPAGVTSSPVLPAEIAATDIDAAALGILGVNEAAMDFYTNSTFEIQGLDPTKTYDLTFFGSHKYSQEAVTVYSVYTDSTFTTLVDSVDLAVMDATSPWLHNRDQVATITGLAPQANDILYVKFEGVGGNEGYLNALQIVEVPEPLTISMLLFGTALLRRRKA